MGVNKVEYFNVEGSELRTGKLHGLFFHGNNFRVPTIRENQGKIFLSGKSGKVRELQYFFVESQGKSRNFDLA